MEISVFHREGKGIREIARSTGLSRNTVRAVRGERDDVYGPRSPRVTKLGAHKAYLRERITAAGERGLAATVLLREIQERGYDGGITQLKLLLAKLRPRRVVEPIIRFETAPGNQLQIDFVVFRRGEHPLRAFTASLGYSRMSYVEFVDNERVEMWITCLENALIKIGGVPNNILCDNSKAIVLERNAYADGLHRFHPMFNDFAAQYGFSIKLCRPYRAQTKGITYIPTWSGFLFLAVVMDVFSRRVVGWAMANHMRKELVVEALDMAIYRRKPKSVVHHSDQGSQYTSIAFGKRCKEAGIQPSMGSVGDCYDNAMCESFNATLECELLAKHRFKTQREASLAIFDFIEAWYNPHRRHSALGYLSPINYERRMAEAA